MNVLSLYIFVVIFFSWASALERAEPTNHHPVLSKTLFLFGYLKHLTRLRIFNFFITPLHLKFAHALYLDYLNTKVAKICGVHAGVLSSGALFFFEGGANKKKHFKSHVLASPVQLPTTAMA